jgi:hypothetical protein
VRALLARVLRGPIFARSSRGIVAQFIVTSICLNLRCARQDTSTSQISNAHRRIKALEVILLNASDKTGNAALDDRLLELLFFTNAPLPA